jgi:hypothetical protein
MASFQKSFQYATPKVFGAGDLILKFSREIRPEKNSEIFGLFLPLVKNTYLTERPPARFFARIYWGFVFLKKWSS